MPEADHGVHDQRISRYIATGEAHIIGGTGRVLEAQHKDGAHFSMELWVGAVDSEEGGGFIGIIRRFDQQSVLEEIHTTNVPIGQPPEGDRPRLTKREIEVLHILAGGGRNKDIAAEMTVSLHTVKFHIENLYNKLGVRTRGELIRVATRFGLLTE
jgi:DNA-binding NarL/FixJ family response regulator